MNAIEVKPPLAPEGYQFDANGNLPFLKRLDGATWSGQVIPYSDINSQAPDFTTPNEAFWAGVDAFLAYAEQKGLLVLWFPAYVGYDRTDWWMEMMVASGSTRMRTYGAWIANRYRSQKNLIWMLGGDKGTGAIPFNSSELAVESALIDGLKSVVTVSKEYSSECPWVDVEGPLRLGDHGERRVCRVIGHRPSRGSRLGVFSENSGVHAGVSFRPTAYRAVLSHLMEPLSSSRYPGAGHLTAIPDQANTKWRSSSTPNCRALELTGVISPLSTIVLF
jgi:hypothetical protein